VPNVLPYHIGYRNQYSLEFVNPDREEFKEHLANRTITEGAAFKSREVTIETDDGTRTLYAVYCNTVPELILEEQTVDEIEGIFDSDYTDDQIQVLGVIIDVFNGIAKRVEEEDGSFSIYKDMNLRKIPEILEYPNWGDEDVAVIGGQLLSRFILAHPMPNANHRTAIGLLERYLRSHGDQLSLSDTGQQGTWYDWARPYIHDSKRLLTVRRNMHVFRYARKFGIDVVRRKNDVDIDLREYDLSADDPFAHFGTAHEKRSIDFVETILEQSSGETTQIKNASDPGWDAFVDALRTD